MLIDHTVVHPDRQVLPADVDGRPNIGVEGLGRHTDALTKEVDVTVLSNKPDQVIAASRRFGERMPRRLRLVWKSQRRRTGGQYRIGRAPAEFAVAVMRVVARLKGPVGPVDGRGCRPRCAATDQTAASDR